MTTDAAAPLHQAVAIEHGMDGAFGRNGDAGEPADQTLADLARTPTGVLMLHAQDVVLHLKGEFIGVAIGTSAPVGQPLHPTFLVAIKDLVAGLAGDAELPAQLRHGLASYVASHKLKPFVHYRTLLPRHRFHFLPSGGGSVTYVSGTKCYPCVGSLTGSRGLFWIFGCSPKWSSIGARIRTAT